MARSICIEYPSAFYHLMARGNRREAIFRSEVDRQLFLRTLGKACAMTGWRVHAWVLMSNHHHLFIETPEANLVANRSDRYPTFIAQIALFSQELMPDPYSSYLVESSQQQPGELNPFRRSSSSGYEMDKLHDAMAAAHALQGGGLAYGNTRAENGDPKGKNAKTFKSWQGAGKDGGSEASPQAVRDPQHHERYGYLGESSEHPGIYTRGPVHEGDVGNVSDNTHNPNQIKNRSYYEPRHADLPPGYRPIGIYYAYAYHQNGFERADVDNFRAYGIKAVLANPPSIGAVPPANVVKFLYFPHE